MAFDKGTNPIFPQIHWFFIHWIERSGKFKEKENELKIF